MEAIVSAVLGIGGVLYWYDDQPKMTIFLGFVSVVFAVHSYGSWKVKD